MPDAVEHNLDLILDNLVKLIKNYDGTTTAKIEEILQSLPVDTLEAVFSKTTKVDVFDGTLLHIAIYKRNLSLVTLLIRFNARLDIPVNGKTPIELIRSLTSKDGKNDTLKDIQSFVLSRENWRGYTGLVLNRLVHLLEDGYDAMPTTMHEDAVLTYGDTQTGKSTWHNYLHGTEYRVLKAKEGLMPYAERTAGTAEHMGIGDGRSSKTLYPTVAKNKVSANAAYRFIDMPGFGDTRTDEEAICVQVSSQMFMKKVVNLKIRAVMIIAPYSSLIEGGHISLRRLFLWAKNGLNGYYKNLIFVITKIPSEIESQPLSEKTERVKQELGKFRLGLQNTLEKATGDKKSQITALLDILSPIIIGDSPIIIGDISKSNARQAALTHLDSMSAIPATNFQFDHKFAQTYDHERGLMKLQVAMDYLANDYMTRYRHAKDAKEKRDALRRELRLKKDEQRAVEDDIELRRGMLTQEVVLDQSKVDALSKQIERLRICIEVANDAIGSLSREPEKISQQIKKLTEDTSTYILDTVYGEWPQEPNTTLPTAPLAWYQKLRGATPEPIISTNCKPDDHVCRDKELSDAADSRGRVDKAVVFHQILQSSQDQKVAIVSHRITSAIGCNFTTGVYRDPKDPNSFTEVTVHEDIYQQHLRNGTFQGRVQGTYDSVTRRLVRGNISIYIELLGNINMRNDTLFRIEYLKKKRNDVTVKLAQEQAVRDYRILQKSKFETELVEIHDAPNIAERQKARVTQELEQLKARNVALKREIKTLLVDITAQTDEHLIDEAVLSQAIFEKIRNISSALNLHSVNLDAFHTTVKNHLELKTHPQISLDDQVEEQSSMGDECETNHDACASEGVDSWRRECATMSSTPMKKTEDAARLCETIFGSEALAVRVSKAQKLCTQGNPSSVQVWQPTFFTRFCSWLTTGNGFQSITDSEKATIALVKK